MGTFPIIRVIVFWGLYWGPPVLGNYQITLVWGLGLRGILRNPSSQRMVIFRVKLGCEYWDRIHSFGN